MLLEKDLISREISIPIYLTTESEYLNEVYDKLTSSVDWDSSAASGNRRKLTKYYILSLSSSLSLSLSLPPSLSLSLSFSLSPSSSLFLHYW